MHKKLVLFVCLFLLSFVLRMQSVNAAGSIFAYITNTLDDTVSIIDISNNRVSSNPIKVGKSPIGVAIALIKQKVFITNVVSDTVSIIDTSIVPNAVIGTISVGPGPNGIAITPDEKKVYVANFGHSGMNGNTVSVIDTATNNVTTIFVGSNPRGIAASLDGKKVYVTNMFSNSVSVIDVDTDKVVENISSVGHYPSGIAITPDGKKVYVGNSSGYNVSVIDTSVTPSRVVANIITGDTPNGIAITPDGKKVYVANTFSSTVSVIDTITDSIVTNVPVPAGPIGVAVTPKGERVYVATVGTNSVSIINTLNDTIDPISIPVGNSPSAFGKFITPSCALITGVGTSPLTFLSMIVAMMPYFVMRFRKKMA